MRHGLPFLGCQVSILFPVHPFFFCRRWDKKEGNSFTEVGGHFLELLSAMWFAIKRCCWDILAS